MMASRETRYRITCAAASPPNFRVGDGVLDNVCSMAILLHRRVPCIGPGRMPLRTHVETPMRHIAAAAGRVRTIGQLSFAGVGNFIHVLHIWSPVIGPGSRGRSRAHAAAPRLRPKEATIRFGCAVPPRRRSRRAILPALLPVTHLLPRRRLFRIFVIGVTYEPTSGRLHTPKPVYLASEGAQRWRLK